MTQLPPTPKSDKIGLVFLASAVVALLIGAFVMVAAEARADESQLPREGVVSLLYIEGHWTVTLESADASEVKLITPAPQEIACSEEQGQPKNGQPLCDKLSYTFASQAECITVQVDWTNNLHVSTDPPACKETPWPPATTSTGTPATEGPASSEPPATATATPTSPAVSTPSSESPATSVQTQTSASMDSISSITTETGKERSRSASAQLAATGLDRKQLIALGIAAGLGLGLGFVLLIELFQRKRK